MKVLLIIDMQKESFTQKTPRWDSEGVIKRINILIDYFRRNELPIIFIQHDGSNQDFCIPNTEEWEILDELNKTERDLVLSKTTNDPLYQTPLHNVIKTNNFTDVVVTGCGTDFCVDSTVKSLISADFNITIINDAHTTTDRFGIESKTIIEYFNWIWRNLITEKSKVTLTSTSDFVG
ncbi:isochorismatase family protein [Candidatus Kapabacteria bacterium]|nr:isochorismatase family protein [Candidatus Kapabacteria bacterium]